ncbi:MAG: tetraacyldisaccharide 4'-kinase [Deltaproteobacteria bacterium]|nr:tetraacyldisaccharide 4'-kinase [Deltaproteobacteria bacterium]
MSSVYSSLSPVWAITNWAARKLLSARAVKLPAPVISVGNIVAGGVGKTEISAAIAARLVAKGKRVAVASRGYGSAWSRGGGVAADLETARALKFPDEAMVILKKARGAAVSVGADRVAVLKKHWEELRPDVVILDDGFQHFRIRRDLDILVHDFSVKWPLLRDMPSYFSRVGVRVALSEVPRMWRKIPWVRARYHIHGKLPSEAMVFCGIGNPSRFTKLLVNAGVNVQGARFFRDHCEYAASDARKLLEWRRRNGDRLPLLTTLKDYVKLWPLLESQGGVAGFEPMAVEIGLEFLENEDLLWKAVDATVVP